MNKFEFKRKSFTENFKQTFASESGKKYLKRGMYSSAMTAIFIGIIIVVNFLAAGLPASMTQFDMSSQKLYTLTETTKQMLSGLEKDVTLYYVVSSGSEDSTVEKMLEQYEESSDYIHLEKKDPSVYPKFTKQYTEDDLAQNSIIVVCNDKSRVINYSDMWETTVDYYTYSQQTTAYDGEGQLTSAVSYVSSDETVKIYWSAGHGEASKSQVSSGLSEGIDKNNLTVEEMNLLTQDIPEDSQCFVICGPVKDFTAEEADKVITYLEKGGHVLVLTNYTEDDMPNFDRILRDFGVEIEDGIIIEGDNKYYYPQYPYYLLPEIETDSMTASVGDYYVLMPFAQAIQKIESYRDTLTMTSLLTTTSASYIETDLQNSAWTPSDNSVKGPFDVGMSIRENVDGRESLLVIFSCANMLESQIDEAVSGTNSKLVLDILVSICEAEEQVSVPVKSLEMENLVFTAEEVNFWSIITILVIPAAVLIIGFIIWLKRRKR